jgi:AcrR family transcriptional regulator
VAIDRTSAPTEKRGRPRRFDDGTERDMVLDAAIQLLKRNGEDGLSVIAILADTGLSTRSFYRHFESKEALLVALVRREAELVARAMDRGIARTAGSVAGIEAWLDRLLDTFFEPAQARRSALLTSPSTSGAYLLTEELAATRWILSRPLADVLRAGNASTELRSTKPEADAIAMFAVAGALAHSPQAGLGDRLSVRTQFQLFVWPGLGLGPP